MRKFIGLPDYLRMCGLVIIARENRFGYFLVFPLNPIGTGSSEKEVGVDKPLA
jgi:hypothetical protein